MIHFTALLAAACMDVEIVADLHYGFLLSFPSAQTLFKSTKVIIIDFYPDGQQIGAQSDHRAVQLCCRVQETWRCLGPNMYCNHNAVVPVFWPVIHRIVSHPSKIASGGSLEQVEFDRQNK